MPKDELKKINEKRLENLLKQFEKVIETKNVNVFSRCFNNVYSRIIKEEDLSLRKKYEGLFYNRLAEVLGENWSYKVD